MEYPEKNQITSYTEAKNDDNVDELVILYYFKCCSGEIIFLTIIFSIVIFFPFIFFLFYCRKPYKNVVIIDQKQKVLMICDKGMIPCCKINAKTFSLNNIKKIEISEAGFKNGPFKYQTMKGYILFNTGEKLLLFSLKYDEQKLNEVLSFFKKYFNTEFIPLKNLVDINNIPPKGNNNDVINLNDNNNSNSDDKISTKQPYNEEAAVPAFV